MEDNKEVEQKVDEKVEEVAAEVKEQLDRPEENYKAEIARKNARIAQLEAERVAHEESKPKFNNDSKDITNWDDNSLKLLRNSNDPNLAQYKDQADDILLERKVKVMQAREYENRRKEDTQRKLETEYPEAVDPTSEFSMKVDKVMKEHDLARTPSGRFLAAKIVALESKKSGNGQKEADRVSRVKANMVDGDRPKPTESKSQSETDLKKKILNEKSTDSDAIGQWVDSKGLRERFGKTWGH